MTGRLTLEELESHATAGRVDTVIVAAPDMQGRLMGKRFTARHFLDAGHEETHCCNYLLATDMEMNTVPGYAAANWAQGYGDYTLKPDLSTLRLIPWEPGTALAIGDFLDHHGELVPHAPRTMLKRQLERLAALGFGMNAATELEFFLFREGFEALSDANWAAPTPFGRYNEDYNIHLTARSEGLIRKVRNQLAAAGVPVESTKGEAEAGQAEINVRYADAMTTADHHVLVKQAVKTLAHEEGRAVTFMAKWSHERAGSSSHIHQSLTKDGAPAFFDAGAGHSMSETMRRWLGGLLAHAAETTLLLAPYVNSYKRFCVGMFAPTKTVWSMDNRTAGFRVVGEGTKAVRVENRIGGSDLNPYLALAGQIAAGIAGLEGRLEPGPSFAGDAYGGKDAPEIPKTLREATEAFAGSAMLRAALGDAVVEHYVHAARVEQADFDSRVTDYERSRGFERA